MRVRVNPLLTVMGPPGHHHTTFAPPESEPVFGELFTNQTQGPLHEQQLELVTVEPSRQPLD